MTDPLQTELALMRPQLLRFADLQLRSRAHAEDVVQEALLAAVANASAFSGAASLRTWVFAILRNKIIDELRRRRRAAETSEDFGDTASADEEGDEFAPDGHWARLPSAWGDPAATLEQKRFWEVFEACLDGLQEKPARVFMMRELLGLETEEICKELGISSSNCWVLLHRARLGLRSCLSRNWFDPDGRGA
jgi:RNA polymerase sigma-70 factor (ECF subfamily)